MLKLRLRLADQADKNYFLALRNDPDSVRGSGSKVSSEEHEQYWATTSDLLVVAVCDKVTIGTMRVNSHGLVSIVVDPLARGHGFAAKMLRALRPFAKQFG